MYQEESDSRFTHQGQVYHLNPILRAAQRTKLTPVPVADLEWILNHTKPDEERVQRADVKTPILVHKLQDRLVPIDGLHRLAKAKKIGLGQLQAYLVSDDMLERNKYLKRVKGNG